LPAGPSPVPIEQRLEEVPACSAALLADEIERSGGLPRVERLVPVGHPDRAFTRLTLEDPRFERALRFL